MNVGFDTWRKPDTTVFIVKNISSDKKTIKIFSVKIPFGTEFNLLDSDYVSEADIRNSLLKGVLKSKIKSSEINIIESNINLSQVDDEHRQFLEEAGIDTGIQAPSAVLTLNKRNSFNQNTWLRIGHTSMSNTRGWPVPASGKVKSFFYSSQPPSGGPTIGIRIIQKRSGVVISDLIYDTTVSQEPVEVLLPTPLELKKGDSLHVRGAVGSSGNNSASNPFIVIPII